MASCAACGTGDQLDGARFCHACGSALSSVCSSCGAALAAGARFCSSCGAAQGGGIGHHQAAAPPAPPAPVAERRLTSVLFGDLVGFTALSAQRDTEEIRELLTRYFDESRQIVERYGGVVEKFI